MTKIISISLADGDKEFLELMELSPSGLMKQKIDDVKKNSINYQNKIAIYEQTILKLRKLLEEYSNFLDSKGLLSEINNVLEKKD